MAITRQTGNPTQMLEEFFWHEDEQTDERFRILLFQ